MRSVRRLNIVLLFAVAFMSAFLVAQLVPSDLSTNITAVDKNEKEARSKRLHQIYDVNFIMRKSNHSSAAAYVPIYNTTTKDKAEKIAEIFEVSGEAYDFDEYYFFVGEDSSLSINKYLNLIEYKSGNLIPNDEIYDIIDKNDAIEVARVYLAEKLPEKKLGAITAKENNDIYTISFYENLSGILNHAFHTKIEIGMDGEILNVEYYDIEFEIISTVSLKTVEQAFLELPIATEFEDKIDLSSCRLVYGFFDSLVMPCYLFEGKTPDGDDYYYYVRACEYK